MERQYILIYYIELIYNPSYRIYNGEKQQDTT